MKTINVIGKVAGVFIIALALPGVVKAQNYTMYSEAAPELKRFEIGAHCMPMLTDLKLSTSSGETATADATIGYGYGGLVGYNFSKYFGLQGEVNYNPISQKFKDRTLEHTVKVNYIDIPVMFSLNTGKTSPVNLNILAGPQFGVSIGSSIKTTGTDSEDQVQATVAVKKGDIGLAYGAGFEFSLADMHWAKLDIGFRGMYGLIDMSAKPKGSDTYNVLLKAGRKSYGGYAGFKFAF